MLALKAHESPSGPGVRDLGVSAVVADATSIYLRYDGEITGSDDNHVFSAGLRMTW